MIHGFIYPPTGAIKARRMGGRAVECTGLENQHGCEPIVGSNPTPSAIRFFWGLFGVFIGVSAEFLVDLVAVSKFYE